MPKKYHIEVRPTPNRYPQIGRSGIVDWGEGCLKCPSCVKHECVYNVYRQRTFSAETNADTIDELCKDCFRCVQGCPKRLIHKALNPEWENLGDDVYTPEVVAANWEQAKTGKIPVSGAGYGGAFVGKGFDSMWTDMSEIVRPTRDGIHGREYISTVVDLGRWPANLRFDERGNLSTQPLPMVRVPIPVLFDIPAFGDMSSRVWHAVALAASELGTLAIIPQAEVEPLSDLRSWLVPLLETDGWDRKWIRQFRMVELADSSDTEERFDRIKRIDEGIIVSVRVPATVDAATRAWELTDHGVDIIHFVADERGYEPGVPDARHLKDVIRAQHGALVERGVRDEITVMASGGIAMAEHVIKSILCGANVVGIDLPLLLALECRLCRNCAEGGECPVRLSTIDPRWGAQRIVNLVGAWHNQCLEMMGAMGIREARRLRGEEGRVMFFEDLETDTFARLFKGREG